MMKTISIKRKEPRMNGGKVNRSGTIANRQDAKDAKKVVKKSPWYSWRLGGSKLSLGGSQNSPLCPPRPGRFKVVKKNPWCSWRLGGSKPGSQSPRGMVLILVVAILVLLAIMGTIFIVVANTDKQSVYASNDAISMNFARQGVLNIIRGDMLNQTLDQNGNVLAIDPTLLTDRISRFWDYPEMGSVSTTSLANTLPFYEVNAPASNLPPSPAMQLAPSQPWLVSNLPWEPDTNYVAGDEVIYADAAASLPTLYLLSCNTTHLSGAPGSNPTASGHWTTVSNISSTKPLLSMLTPYLYDPTTGLYDIGLSWNSNGTPVTIPGGSYKVNVPNASVVEPRWFYNSANPSIPSQNGTLDALWNLLPYSGPGGTRYRFALRIVDLSSRLNLNSGYPGGSADPYPGVSPDPYGEYLSSCPIWLSYVSGSPADNSNVQYLQTSTSPPGREGTSASPPYTLQTWQTQELFNYELPVPPPTQFFGLTSELELLTYGSYGSSFGSTFTGGRLPDGGLPYNCRPALILPYTLGATTNGMLDATNTGYRSFFTTYSWDRNYFPEARGTAPYSLVTNANSYSYPDVLNLNQPTTPAEIGTLAENIAYAMLDAGYTSMQADSFAVNYVTYRFYTIPDRTTYSPAYVDSRGELYIPWMSSYTPVALMPPVYNGQPYALMGFAAQPFLNELAVAATYPKGGPVSFNNCAVELFNPFNVSLNLSGWQIKIYNESTGTYSSPPVTLSTSISPADGYLVIAENGSTGFTPPPQGTVIPNPNLVFPSSAPFQVVLFRPGGPTGYFPVDAFDTLYTPPAPAPPESVFDNITVNGTFSIQRANGAVGTSAMWGCAQAVPPLSHMVGGDSLGAINSSFPTPTGQAIPLYDRFADGYAPLFVSGTPPTIDSNLDLINLADLNCIPRQANSETQTTGVPLPLSLQLEQDVLLPHPFPPGASTFNGEQYQYHTYFDFAYDPRAAFTCATTTTGTVKPSFLSMISLNDRAGTSTPGGLPNPVDAVRIPGKINVNTAGANVLTTAFSNVPSTTGLTPQQMAADVIAFRNRDPVGTINIPDGSGGVTAEPHPDYSNSTNYPGYGLRSLGDMLVAFLPSEMISGIPPTTMQQCDAAWADVANFCTVRSDTFAVYGLIQALKLNGNYTGTYLPTDWYNANQGNFIGTSPTYENTIATDNPNSEFILLGQRRFIAIIDRSFSNMDTGPGGTTIIQPKVVALKNLPQ